MTGAATGAGAAGAGAGVLIGVAEQHGGGKLTCTQEITDAAYGSVRWVQPNGRSASLSFYAACRECAARAVVEQRRRLVEDPRDRLQVARAIEALTLEP